MAASKWLRSRQPGLIASRHCRSRLRGHSLCLVSVAGPCSRLIFRLLQDRNPMGERSDGSAMSAVICVPSPYGIWDIIASYARVRQSEILSFGDMVPFLMFLAYPLMRLAGINFATRFFRKNFPEFFQKFSRKDFSCQLDRNSVIFAPQKLDLAIFCHPKAELLFIHSRILGLTTAFL